MPNNRLEQRKLGKSQIFTIEEENLSVSVESARQTWQWKVPLASIQPEPMRYKRRALLPPLVAVLVIVALYICFTVGGIASTTSTSKSGATAVIYVGTLILAVVALLWFKKRGIFHSSDFLSFTPQNGHRLNLWFENPSKVEFESFVVSLKKAIEKARLNNPESSASISTEILRLKRLLDDGAISQAQFEAAKNKIVGLDPPGRIGF